jgi:hypothetical protein
MRIGVLLRELPPDLGGGFTFEHDVFETLLRLAFITTSWDLVPFLRCWRPDRRVT